MIETLIFIRSAKLLRKLEIEYGIDIPVQCYNNFNRTYALCAGGKSCLTLFKDEVPSDEYTVIATTNLETFECWRRLYSARKNLKTLCFDVESEHSHLKTSVDEYYNLSIDNNKSNSEKYKTKAKIAWKRLFIEHKEWYLLNNNYMYLDASNFMMFIKMHNINLPELPRIMCKNIQIVRGVQEAICMKYNINFLDTLNFVHKRNKGRIYAGLILLEKNVRYYILSCINKNSFADAHSMCSFVECDICGCFTSIIFAQYGIGTYDKSKLKKLKWCEVEAFFGNSLKKMKEETYNEYKRSFEEKNAKFVINSSINCLRGKSFKDILKFVFIEDYFNSLNLSRCNEIDELIKKNELFYYCEQCEYYMRNVIIEHVKSFYNDKKEFCSHAHCHDGALFFSQKNLLKEGKYKLSVPEQEIVINTSGKRGHIEIKMKMKEFIFEYEIKTINSNSYDKEKVNCKILESKEIWDENFAKNGAVCAIGVYGYKHDKQLDFNTKGLNVGKAVGKAKGKAKGLNVGKAKGKAIGKAKQESLYVFGPALYTENELKEITTYKDLSKFVKVYNIQKFKLKKDTELYRTIFPYSVYGVETDYYKHDYRAYYHDIDTINRTVNEVNTDSAVSIYTNTDSATNTTNVESTDNAVNTEINTDTDMNNNTKEVILQSEKNTVVDTDNAFNTDTDSAEKGKEKGKYEWEGLKEKKDIIALLDTPELAFAASVKYGIKAENYSEYLKEFFETKSCVLLYRHFKDAFSSYLRYCAREEKNE